MKTRQSKQLGGTKFGSSHQYHDCIGQAALANSIQRESKFRQSFEDKLYEIARPSDPILHNGGELLVKLSAAEIEHNRKFLDGTLNDAIQDDVVTAQHNLQKELLGDRLVMDAMKRKKMELEKQLRENSLKMSLNANIREDAMRKIPVPSERDQQILDNSFRRRPLVSLSQDKKNNASKSRYVSPMRLW